MEKQTGYITSLIKHKGIGFITKEDGSRIFFHISGLIRPEYMELREGFSCEFMEVPTNAGPKAIGIVAHEPE